VAVTIVCPTHGRAGNVKTFRVFGDDLLLSVSESQAPLYREAYPDAELDVHPDSVVGLSAKRQFRYDRFGDVFMVDDDVASLMDMARPAGGSARVDDPQRARDVVQRAFDQAEDMGAFLFGFNQNADPAMYRPQLPFRLTGFIGGHAMGVRKGSKLWFPKTGMHGSEDMWVSALNAHAHRFCLIDQRYCFVQLGTFSSKGGQAAMRTMKSLEVNLEALRESFGDAITRKKGTMRAGLSHEFQITLNVPW
jgi:hypothetical protein